MFLEGVFMKQTGRVECDRRVKRGAETDKNPKKYTIIKKSCTFAAENEFYLFT